MKQDQILDLSCFIPFIPSKTAFVSHAAARPNSGASLSFTSRERVPVES